MKTLVGSSAMAKSFAASAVASPYAMHAYPTCQTTSSWYKELDEVRMAALQRTAGQA